LRGVFPDILKDAEIGKTAAGVYEDARAMLDLIVRDNLLTARAVIGFFPANSTGDDVEVYTDESRTKVRTVFHFLRQQMSKATDRPQMCLADFIAPSDTGIPDYIGGFALTTGAGIEEALKRFEQDHDSYKSILLKSLADRLAEAFTEHIHERVRKEFWGYAAAESLDNDALIREEYQGIRPAPGYPACPDHTEKGLLFDLIEAPKLAGIQLTESYAMMPGAAVSGFYFSHPQSAYFGLGRIGKDQVQDYAKRKGLTVEEVEKWLGPNLAYEK
jgi:5-methyltetrahydrofolate--homocysteine methyltransferase